MDFERKTIAIPEYDRALENQTKLLWVSQIVLFTTAFGMVSSAVPLLHAAGLTPLYILLPAALALWACLATRTWLLKEVEFRRINRRRTAGHEIVIDQRGLKIASGLVTGFDRHAKDYVEIEWSNLVAWQLPNDASDMHRVTLKSPPKDVLIPGPPLRRVQAELAELILANLKLQTPAPEAKSARVVDGKVRPITPRRIVLGITLWLLTMASIYLWVAFHFVHAFAAELTLATYSILLALPVFALLKRRAAREANNDTRALVLAMITTFVVINFGLRLINALCASASPPPLKLTVEDRFRRSNKGSVSYLAEVRTPPLDRQRYVVDFNESTELFVRRDLFDRVEAGRTQVIVNYKVGLLGLPFLAGYSIDPSTLKEATPVAPKVKREPWVAEVITTSPDAQMREDRWPNGQIRSREPIVDGKVQGIGEYTHANGRPYARIPWKNGEKHGRFKLYRDDGTLESDLSYKNGQPHGMLRWYDAKGELTIEREYVDGRLE